MANPELQRSVRLNLRLSENMMDRVNALCQQMGIPPATLGSVAVAEYVERHDTQRQQMVLIAEKVAESSTRAAEAFFADPKALATLAGALQDAEDKAAGSRKKRK